MAHRPGAGIGTSRKIDPKALFYRLKAPDGSEQFTSVLAFRRTGTGAAELVQGVLWHPVFGSQQFDSKESYLTEAHEPVLALCHDDIPEIVKALREAMEGDYGKRIEELETENMGLVERLEALERRIKPDPHEPAEPTPGKRPEFECVCGKSYASQGGLAYHLKTNPDHAVQPAAVEVEPA